MSNFSEALANAARSGACQVLGVPEYINDALDRIGFFPFTEARRAVPDFWRNMLCDTDAPPVPTSPFTGGQCTARYNVTYTVRDFRIPPGCNAVNINNSLNGYWGPLTPNIRMENRPNGQTGYAVDVINFGNGSFPMSIPQTTTILGPNRSSDCPPAQLVAWNPVRQDGLPDNCGNPDVIIPPPDPSDVTVNRNVTYNNSNNVSVTIPVVFVYARANIDARANITIPFTANINGELNVTGNVNLDGTVNINIGSSVDGGAPKDPRKSPCDDIALPDDEVPPDPTDSEQPAQPDREREEVIKGVLVTVTALSNERASTIVQDDNPDIYVPSLGHVQFLCRVGETSAAWTSDIPVKNRRNLIQCPWDWGAVEVRGTPQPGVTWQLTPIVGYAGLPVEYVT